MVHNDGLLDRGGGLEFTGCWLYRLGHFFFWHRKSKQVKLFHYFVLSNFIFSDLVFPSILHGEKIESSK